MILGDVTFALFLRLILELTKSNKGTVSRSVLINTGFIKPGSEFQSISRLRELFRTCLGDADPEEFIETCESKSVRLSTRPSVISYDKPRLLGHRSQKVRRVAAQSLGHVVDLVNRSLFYRENMASAERAQLASWISSLLGKPGSSE